MLRKTFETETESGTELEELNVDYMVLFGTYNNEHPELHYGNRKSSGKVYETLEEAKGMAEGSTDTKIWEVAHSEDGSVAFLTEME